MIRILFILATMPYLVSGPMTRPNIALCQSPPATVELSISSEAIRLLEKSRKETCSVCIDNLREEAFGILTESMRPYTRLSAGKNCPLVFSKDDGEPEFQPVCYAEISDPSDRASDLPVLIFRFHTRDRHMIGISPEDFTNDTIADFIFSAPRDAVFHGVIELVPFRYGDGPTFIYFDETNRLAIQCRILEIETIECSP